MSGDLLHLGAVEDLENEARAPAEEYLPTLPERSHPYDRVVTHTILRAPFSHIDVLRIQAAAPQQPEIIPNESAHMSTGSLIDVDSQSVRTVPSDFMEQEVQTTTQQERIEREAEAAELREKAAVKKEKAKNKAHKADHWLINKIASLSDNEATALVYLNLSAVVGISAFLGLKGWRLHERGALSWKTAGVGAAVLGAVGVVEGVFSRYFAKARGTSK